MEKTTISTPVGTHGIPVFRALIVFVFVVSWCQSIVYEVGRLYWKNLSCMGTSVVWKKLKIQYVLSATLSRYCCCCSNFYWGLLEIYMSHRGAQLDGGASWCPLNVNLPLQPLTVLQLCAYNLTSALSRSHHYPPFIYVTMNGGIENILPSNYHEVWTMVWQLRQL